MNGVQGEVELLNLTKVKRITTLSEDDIENLCLSGKFPKPILLSRDRGAWLKSEVYEWILTKVNQR